MIPLPEDVFCGEDRDTTLSVSLRYQKALDLTSVVPNLSSSCYFVGGNF